MTFQIETFDRRRLALGFLGTGILALSVHVFLLQGLGVPFPDLALLTPPFKFLGRALATLGLIVIWQFAAPSVGGGFARRWAVAFVVTALLTESLLRGPFMTGYCATGTTAWTFAFVSNAPKLLGIAATVALVGAAAPRLQRVWQRLLGAFVITALALFGVGPLIGAVMGPIMQAIAPLAPAGEWCALPYGAKVLIPAYLSFAEPTLGCLLAVALVWPHLSVARGLRFVQFSLLVLAIKNQLLLPLLYALVANTSFRDSMLSAGQFTLEAGAMSVLMGLSWEWSHVQAARRTGGRTRG